MSKPVHFDITRSVPVGKSSQISRAEYSTESKVLRIHFRSGGTYDYSDVPIAVACVGLTSQIDTRFSIGKWFIAEIKPHYPCAKIARELTVDHSADEMSDDEYRTKMAREAVS